MKSQNKENVDSADFVASQKVLESYFRHNNIAKAKSLLEKKCVLRNKSRDDTKLDLDVHSLLMECCVQGRDELLLYLYEVCMRFDIEIDIHAHEEQAFRWACYYGHLSIALLLFNLSQRISSTKIINIRAVDDWAFSWSCSNKCISTTKWLASICPAYVYFEETNTYVILSSYSNPKDFRFDYNQMNTMFCNCLVDGQTAINTKDVAVDRDCCPICLEEDRGIDRWVDLGCGNNNAKHVICFNCFLKIRDRCPLDNMNLNFNSIKLLLLQIKR